MKKLVIVALLIIGTIGCSIMGGNQEQELNDQEPTARLVMDKIQEKLAERYDLRYENGTLWDLATEDPLYHLTDIKSEEDTEFSAFAKHFNVDEIKAGYILEPVNAAFSSELIMVVESNSSDGSTHVGEAMAKVLSDQEVIWVEHIPDQYEFVKLNRIERQGNFTLYATSIHVDEIVRVFQEVVQ